MPAEKTFTNDKTAFSNMLDSAMGGTNNPTQTTNAKLLEFVDSLNGDGGGVKEISATDIKVDVARAAEVEGIGGNKAGILDMLKEVNNSQINMDQLIENMMSGFGKKSMSAQEAFRVQVFAQMHAVHMEVISKVGEMANKAISTPFNMQVG
ncbi:MAG TPA: hypothetical protein DF383_00010 [Deltaproteobacteria bacterium]|nr:hypothetical protein [Deltaproteobacteria bacterium]